MFSLKPGSRIVGARPELVIGLIAVHEVFKKNDFEMVVTEVTGGEHMENSLHYKGLAADIRSKNLLTDEMKLKVLCESRLALGENFDMILESAGHPNEHFHLEVDPGDN